MNRDKGNPQHPDAELLNAFAEGALSAEERLATLEHLESCDECRQVVFLVTDISTQEQVPIPSMGAQNAPLAGGSGTAWKIPTLLYGGIAAAALVVGTVLLFHKPQSRSAQTSAITQQQSEKAIVPRSEPRPLEPSLSITRKEKESKEKRLAVEKKIIDSEKNPLVAKIPLESPVEDKSSFVLQDVQTFAFQSENGGKSSNRLQPVSSGIALSLQKQQQKVEQGNASVSGAGGRLADVAIAEHSSRNPLRVQASGHPAGALVPSQSEVLVFPRANASEQDKPFLELLRVPSDKNVISFAKRKKDVVAIDSEGAVFFSSDVGVHWQQVPVQWKGKADSVQVFQNSQYRPDLSRSSGSVMNMPAGGSFFELKNDSFESWSSSDGRTWVPKK